MIGYFANLAIPRMGEFTRCGVVSKYEKVPFSNLLGTVVNGTGNRYDDIMALTVVVVVTQFKQVGIFLDNNPEIREKLNYMFHSAWMLFIVVAVLVVVALCWKFFLRDRLQGRIRSFFPWFERGSSDDKK